MSRLSTAIAAPRIRTPEIDKHIGGLASIRTAKVGVCALAMLIPALPAIIATGLISAGGTVAALVVGTAFGLAGVHYSAKRRLRDLFKSGAAVQGQVTGTESAHARRLTYRTDPSWGRIVVHYEYTVQGQGYASHNEHLRGWQVESWGLSLGSPVLIVYDPKKPKRHVAVFEPQL